jgi:hypothetical protein
MDVPKGQRIAALRRAWWHSARTRCGRPSGPRHSAQRARRKRNTPWVEFHRSNMQRWNWCENLLSVGRARAASPAPTPDKVRS